ncbi:MAG: hypothetical protein L6R37_008101 [Teloschistes peruensis]|nr:MAG: hypothetical protein L6R37_008101 [Teloschistes peruensis]
MLSWVKALMIWAYTSNDLINCGKSFNSEALVFIRSGSALIRTVPSARGITVLPAPSEDFFSQASIPMLPSHLQLWYRSSSSSSSVESLSSSSTTSIVNLLRDAGALSLARDPGVSSLLADFFRPELEAFFWLSLVIRPDLVRERERSGAESPT